MIEQTLFISDLHLGQGSPQTNRRFLKFLNTRARGVERLYILGDLFDAWVGDDDNTRFARQIREALAELTQQGTQIYFQRGNRDFLVGDRFSRQTGIELLDDYKVIDLYGTPTLLTHGDLLCTDDHAYQAFRKRSRSPEWQSNVLEKPLWLRLLMVRWYRFRSFLHKRNTNLEIMDVNHAFVIETFRNFRVTRMIHGHTHRPAIHDLKIPADNSEAPPAPAEDVSPTNNSQGTSMERIAKRFVLPAWNSRHGYVLCWNSQGWWEEEFS